MTSITKDKKVNSKLHNNIKRLHNHPSNHNAQITLATFNHYLGKNAIKVENRLNIYGRDYFIGAFKKVMPSANKLQKALFRADMKFIQTDGMCEYFLLDKQGIVHPASTSDVMNVAALLKNKHC